MGYKGVARRKAPRYLEVGSNVCTSKTSFSTGREEACVHP